MVSVLTFTTLALQFFLASSAATKRSSCAVQNPTQLMNLPSGFTAPTEPLSYVAVAIGTQNYTCSAAGNYTNVGAVAELFDISCMATQLPSLFGYITDAAMALWQVAPPNLTPQQIISKMSSFQSPVVLGQHYYVTNPVTDVGVSPKWDFTSSGATAGDRDAYVVAAASHSALAPTGSQDINWVYLTNIGFGELADGIYRTDTRHGQPPASCTPGSAPIAVKYAAKYWLYGGSVESQYN